MTTHPLTVGEYVSAMLELNGIDTVFGIPGVHTLEFYRGIARSGLRHVLVRHEQGAGFAADGFARLSGRPAAAMVISGPGLTNVLTAMGQAYTDSVPVFVIASTAAQHSLGKQWGALHELHNQREIAATVTGHAGHATTPADVRDHLKLAFAALRGARPRPAYLQIPLDVLSMPAGLVPEKFAPAPARPQPDAASITAAARLLAQARQPVIIAGGGASHAGASVQRLAEKLQAMCVLTTAAKGLLAEHHPLNAGAALAYPLTHAAIAAADVVLAVGTELAETDHYLLSLKINGKLIRIDVDPSKFADQYVNDVAILSDAQPALEALTGALDGTALNTQPGAAARQVATLRTAIAAGFDPKSRTLHALLAAIRSALPADAAVCTDMTQIAYAGNYGFATDQPRTWFHPSGYGTLGYALPAAVGAKLSSPDRPVVALAGDFGLQFTLHELMTAVEHELSIPIVVWNNDALGQIRDDMIGASFPPTGVVGRNPDFIALARAYGAAAITARSGAELASAIGVALATRGPTLIEVPAVAFG